MKGAKGAHVESQPGRGSWMTVDQAAVFLHLPCVTFRRAQERNACKLSERGITSNLDGIAARKLGATLYGDPDIVVDKNGVPRCPKAADMKPPPEVTFAELAEYRACGTRGAS